MELGWRKTWDDQDDDFVYCDDTGQTIGRVYIQRTGGIFNGQWRWFFAGSSGFAPSRREALLAVEVAYEGAATGAAGPCT